MPVMLKVSTTALPLASLKIWWGNPLMVSCTAGTGCIPCTLVHCCISSVALIGLTVVSLLPCQIETFGKGPVWLEAWRTKSPNPAGVKVPPAEEGGGHRGGGKGNNKHMPGGMATPPGRPTGPPKLRPPEGWPVLMHWNAWVGNIWGRSFADP